MSVSGDVVGGRKVGAAFLFCCLGGGWAWLGWWVGGEGWGSLGRGFKKIKSEER